MLASHVEVSDDFAVPGFEQGDQVIEDDVHDVLVVHDLLR